MPVLTGPLSPLEQIDPYTWSQNRRTIYGQDFKIIPPYKQIYREQAAEVWIEKAAQLGTSEYLINMVLFAADTMWGERGHALYFFPGSEQMDDFSAERVDPVIWNSPYLMKRQQARKAVNAKAKIKTNVKVKSLGDGVIYFRGTKARSQVVSVDADLVIYDEVDLMPEEVIEAGKIRAQSSKRPMFRGASTPMYPNIGIDALIQRSTNKAWMVKCHKCHYIHDLADLHAWIHPLKGTRDSLLVPPFDDTSDQSLFHKGSFYYVGCPRCKRISNVWNGEWVNTRELSSYGVDFEGYHLPKLFSDRLAGATFDGIAEQVQKEKEGRLSEKATQEFYNSVCGLPRAPKGVQANLSHLKQCENIDHTNFDLAFNWSAYSNTFSRCFLGADIGKRIHITVLAYPHDNPFLFDKTGGYDKPCLVYAGSVEKFEEIPKLFYQYDCLRGVIDTFPEQRLTMELVDKNFGRIYGAEYPGNWSHKGTTIYEYDEEKGQVLCSRSECLGLMFGYIFERNIVFPNHVETIGGYQNSAGHGEFSQHLVALTKIIEEDPSKTARVKYINAAPDHFAHALTYALVAAKATELDRSDIVSPADFLGVSGTFEDKTHGPLYLPGFGSFTVNRNRNGRQNRSLQSRRGGQGYKRPSGY